MSREQLITSFVEVVNHLLNRGELFKAYIVARNAPSYIEDDSRVLLVLSDLKGRLDEISEMQTHGTINGRFNAGFIDPENPEEVVKFKLLKEFIKDKKIKKMVDVGCFTGWVGRRLSLDGIAVHGIDVHPVVIQIAAFAASGTLATFEYLPVEKLGFTHPLEYDGAILFDVLEHCFDPDLVIKSVERSVKAGGYIFLNIPSVEGEQVANTHSLDEHEHLHSFSRLKLYELFNGKKELNIRSVDNEKGVMNWFITYAVS